MTTTETIQQSENIVWATEDGIIEFKRLLEKQEKQAVRLGIQGGGCNGYSYYMEPLAKVANRCILDNNPAFSLYVWERSTIMCLLKQTP